MSEFEGKRRGIRRGEMREENGEGVKKKIKAGKNERKKRR